MVAAAGARLAMPVEDWVQHWAAGKFLYDWQTLVGVVIAGVFALAAAGWTVWATIRSAKREIAASHRLAQRHAAREDFAFHTMLEAAMRRALADATAARKEFGDGPGPNLYERAYAARKSFSKLAFNEVRGACVSHGGRLTETFLELENEIDYFASQTQEISVISVVTTAQIIRKGEPNGLLYELKVIEDRASYLCGEASGGKKQAQIAIVAMEAEPPIQTPPKRSWRLWRARPRA
jgi:hypothetical protein